MPQLHPWPVGLGVAIGTQAQIEEHDAEFAGTIPRLKASGGEIAAFEDQCGERLPQSYREFLLHANGWESFFFTLDLFGLPELRGQGRWNRAQELLASYDAEETLAESGLTAADLLPVGASQGADLIVAVREGRPDAGMTVWFDGGEYGRFDEFGDFFEQVVGMLQSWVGHLAGSGEGAEPPPAPE